MKAINSCPAAHQCGAFVAKDIGMIIDKEILEKWAKLKDHGDHKKILELMGRKPTIGNQQFISRIFKTGRCHSDNFIVLRDFFAAKEKNISTKTPDNVQQQQ